MTAQDLISQFTFNQYTLVRLLADVSQEDSLHAPQKDVNCINWLLGHVLNTRNRVLLILGAEPFWTEGDVILYQAKELPFDPRAAKAMTDLKSIVATSYERLQQALKKAEAKFGDAADGKFIREGETIGERVGYFVCHEQYHIGQIGLIRRLLGKPGLF